MMKKLDDEERLVMQGFASDVRNTHKAAREAKNLTKTLNKDGKLTPAEFAATAPKRSAKPKCKC